MNIFLFIYQSVWCNADNDAVFSGLFDSFSFIKWWVLEFRIMFLMLWNSLGYRWDENPFSSSVTYTIFSIKIQEWGVVSYQVVFSRVGNLQLTALSHRSLNHTIFPALDLLLGNFHRIVTSTFVSNMTITPGMQDCTPSLSSPSPSWLLIKEGKLSATTLICKTMLITITTNCNLKNKSGFCYSQWNKLAIVLYLLYFVVTWPFYIIGGDFQLESFSLLLRYEDLWGNFATRPSLMKIMTERLVRG